MSTSAKVTARQRIENLLDDNSFVEIGAYVKARNTDFNIQAKDTPSDGVITGYGVINGGLVYVYSQDASEPPSADAYWLLTYTRQPLITPYPVMTPSDGVSLA